MGMTGFKRFKITTDASTEIAIAMLPVDERRVIDRTLIVTCDEETAGKVLDQCSEAKVNGVDPLPKLLRDVRRPEPVPFRFRWRKEEGKSGLDEIIRQYEMLVEMHVDSREATDVPIVFVDGGRIKRGVSVRRYFDKHLVEIDSIVDEDGQDVVLDSELQTTPTTQFVWVNREDCHADSMTAAKAELQARLEQVQEIQRLMVEHELVIRSIRGWIGKNKQGDPEKSPE